MKKQILLTVIGMFLLLLLTESSSATIDEIRFIGEQNTFIDVKENCFNNNTYCSDTAKCNITIINPDNIIIINSSKMTNRGSYHNLTLNNTHTNLLGVYEATAMCIDKTSNGFDTFYFKITPNGDEPSLVQGIIYIVLLLTFMILTIFCILGAYFIDKNNAYEYGKLIKITYGKYVKLGLALLSYFFLTIIFLFCEMIANNFLFLSFAKGIFHILYLIGMIGLFPAFLVAMIFIIINALRDIHIKNLSKRNLPIQR